MQNAHTKDMISTRRKFPAIQYSLLPTPLLSINTCTCMYTYLSEAGLDEIYTLRLAIQVYIIICSDTCTLNHTVI